MLIFLGAGAAVSFAALYGIYRADRRGLFHPVGATGCFLLFLIPVYLLGISFFARITAAFGSLPGLISGMSEINLSGSLPVLTVKGCGSAVLLSGDYAGVFETAALAAILLFHPGLRLRERPVAAVLGAALMFLLSALRVTLLILFYRMTGGRGKFLFETYVSPILYYCCGALVYYELIFQYRRFRRKAEGSLS